MLMSLKQRKIKFEPRIKLNHNIYIVVKKIACDPIRTGHALGLKQRAIDFCFYKFEAHISRVYRHLFFPKKMIRKCIPQIFMTEIACVSSTVPGWSSQLDFKL